MKKLLLMIVAIFMAVAVSAQTNKKVIYLKNGTVVRGVVIDQVPGQSIKVRTADGSIFMYTMGEIERMERDEIVDEDTKERKSSGLKEGWHGFVNVYGNWGEFVDATQIAGASLTYGYNFSKHFYLGIGAGYIYDFADSYYLIPAYANIRTFFTKNNYTPYFSLDIGGNMDASSLYLNGGIGVRFKTKYKFGVGVAFNYFISQADLGEEFGDKSNVYGYGLALSFDF